MSTSTFRTAFWVLGVAFGLTVLLVVPNPERLRFAKREQEKPELPHRATLLVQNTDSRRAEEPEAKRQEPLETTFAQEDLLADLSEEKSESGTSLLDEEARPAPPVRVASANPQSGLGHPPIDGRLSAIFDRSESTEVPEWNRQSVENRSVPSDRSEAELDIRVPDPLEMQIPVPERAETDDAVDTPTWTSSQFSAPPQSSLSDPWTKVPSTPEATPPSVMISDVETEPRIAAVQSPDKRTDGSLAKMSEAELERAAVSWRTEPRIQISTGDEFGTWTFRFDEAPLPHVLQALGDYAGQPVVVDPEMRGKYTGEFLNAEPMQLLAILIKLHNCSIDRCGKYYVLEAGKSGH